MTEADLRDDGRAQASVPPIDLPDDHEPPENGDGATYRRSIADDVVALFDDGRTYAEAEFRFQKSRAVYAANRGKYVVLYGLSAFAVFHLALIGLTVGLVFALAPLVGPFVATGLVVAALIVAGFVLLAALRGKLREVRRVYAEKMP